MKYLSFLLLGLACCICVQAQKQVYDIVSYTTPSGWKQENGDHHLAFSKIDGGSWAQIAIYKSTASKGDINADMESEWKTIVEEPHPMQSVESVEPKTAEGWTVMSRSGLWQYNGANVASLLTVYSNGVNCVSILCNATAKPYLEDYKQFIGSVELTGQTATTPAVQTGTPSTTTSSIIGSWRWNTNEMSGTMTTGGYSYNEYTFFEDGTYKFLEKDFSAYNPVIILGYEAGTWSVNGDQLTITPTEGKNEHWSKNASGRSAEWGKLTKTATRTLSPTTYRYELKYFEGMNDTRLVLEINQPTIREGRQSNNDNALNTWTYSASPAGKPLVVLPAGTGIQPEK